MSTLNSILKEVPIPEMLHVQQIFKRESISDIKRELLFQIQRKSIRNLIKTGQKIAVAVGSREIANETVIVSTLINELKKYGAKPFIVPAMGSHGGATAEGQARILDSLGINRSTAGATIVSSMETVRIGSTNSGLSVFLDREAYSSDGIVLVNRVKHHTSFSGPLESGLCKMMAIGLGNQRGAETCHNMGFPSMSENISSIADIVLQKVNILFGVAIIENAYHETAYIEILKHKEIKEQEPELLRNAKRLAAKLFFNKLDVLIIDEAGKNISGTGFDLKLVGRSGKNTGEAGDIQFPDITRIAVLDLTEESHGNSNGIGMADFITKRYFNKIDFSQTYPNSITTTDPARAKIPMVLDSDKLAIKAAIKTCNLKSLETVRLVRIKNTLSLDDILASPAALKSVTEPDRIKVIGEGFKFKFDSRANIKDL
ncbi:MAG: DUF2088 domain-containing protein [Spirochaetales bacterium]|nr:DUF2088 domain-containing protein [Spirochaetales bacterium]